MKCIIVIISALVLVFSTTNALALRDTGCAQKCNAIYEADVNECFANNCSDNTRDCRQKCIFATEPVLTDCIVRNCIPREEDAQSASEEAEATLNTQFSRAVPADETNEGDTTRACTKRCYYNYYASADSNRNTLEQCVSDCNKEKSGLRGTLVRRFLSARQPVTVTSKGALSKKIAPYPVTSKGALSKEIVR